MSIAWLEPDWPAPPGVKALSTFRSGGVSDGRFDSLNLGDHVGDDPAKVAENRRRLASAAELPAEPKWLKQVHGVAVADLDAAELPDAADAAVTRSPGRICAILTADCLPVLFASDFGAVGAAHAGWRGLAAGVIETAFRALRAKPAETLVWLGPAIGPGAFEVGGEVREAFVRHDPGAEEAFSTSANGKYLADLYLLARRRLAALGISRIYGGGQCTYNSEARYFSHRRDGKAGRQATLIWRLTR